ncbi:MAG TPA: fasciclin domain-containing protein [Dinghuibacter sp.]|uniref:fasciclin domain-containing protein n=1 Tax=Dinghuibacter sp. TaxID=2024697 RepID=UPI002C718F8F|nr:fasciclin domain-containing protein [Dinghuibacter sp.]HTJ14267.1 fasciclin domain-containing protein [Dinghuibacter sp.]
MILIGLAAASCTKTEVISPSLGTIHQTLVSNLESNYAFSLFDYALKKTGLNQVIAGQTAYTLLVPDNDAFGRDSIFSTADLDKLDTGYLRRWIGYHIVPGNITVASVSQTVNNPYLSVTGQTLYFSRPIPGPAQRQTAGIDEILHINGDTVNTPDISVSNGTIQVLNRPLRLPVASVQAYLAANAQYSVFVTALKNFGLWDQLSGPGPVTVFAPDNNSFAYYHITPDSVARMDTNTYYVNLFSVYVSTPSRIFITDFPDIGVGNFQSYYTINNVYSWSLYSNNGTGGLVDPGNFYIPGIGSPEPTTWTDENAITLNGVVQGIDGLLWVPGQQIK